MSDKLRVLMISSEYPPFLLGGLGTHVYELTKGLRRKGTEVFVFAHNPGRNEIVSEDSLTVCFFSLPGFNPAQGSAERELNIKDVRELNQLLSERAKAFLSHQVRGIDIIHSHDWFGFDAACELRRTFNAPVISTVHMLHNPFVQWWGNQLDPHVVQAEYAMCRHSDLVVTVSQAMRQTIIDTYGTEAEAVRVIYNGLESNDSDLSPRQQGANSLLSRLAPSGEQIIVYAGRIAPMKGLEYLLLSASQVIKEFKNVVYLICGRHLDDAYAWKLIKLIESDANLRKKVKLLGWQSREQLRELYGIANLAVVPSCFEPFGYAALEPMAAEVPVVATDIGGLSELLAENKGGLLVPSVVEPDGRHHIDVQKLAESQLMLLRNPTFARELARVGYSRATTEFRFEPMIESTHEAYGNLASTSAVVRSSEFQEREIVRADERPF